MQNALSTIASKFPEEEIRGRAEDLLVFMATLGAISSQDLQQQANLGAGRKAGEQASSFRATLKELEDPVVPMRGHALIVLTQLIGSKDEETLRNSATLLRLLKENLHHSDSYVYLAAINALVALALASPAATSEVVLTTLCQEYAGLHGRPDPAARSNYDKVTGKLWTKESPSKQHEIPTRQVAKLAINAWTLICRLPYPHTVEPHHYNEPLVNPTLKNP